MFQDKGPLGASRPRPGFQARGQDPLLNISNYRRSQCLVSKSSSLISVQAGLRTQAAQARMHISPNPIPRIRIHRLFPDHLHRRAVSPRLRRHLWHSRHTHLGSHHAMLMPMELNPMVVIPMPMELRQMVDTRLMGTYPQCTMHTHCSNHGSSDGGHRSFHDHLKGTRVLGRRHGVSPLCLSHTNGGEIDNSH